MCNSQRRTAVEFNTKDWSNSTSVAKIFGIGKAEAAAVSNLSSKVAVDIRDRLQDAVAKRGLRNFITHDLLAKEAFNTGFSSAQASAEAWHDACVNGDDLQLETWFGLCPPRLDARMANANLVTLLM